VPEVVSDTSPLLYLYQAGKLDLLPLLYGRVVVPNAVATELAAGARLGVGVPEPGKLAWAELRTPTPPSLAGVTARLGLGEREVLALGLETQDALLLLDDRAARAHARALGLAATGTLGILLRAKREGHLTAVQPIVTVLEARGFRLDAATRDAVLVLAGEG
jgi:hypothetical protein